MMKALIILGPTASGKGELGRMAARAFSGEIISVDSRKSYKHLDIGTAKPTPQQRREVRYHLLDFQELYQKNNAEAYGRRARDAVRDTISRGNLPVLSGGAGLYFRAILEGLFKIDLKADQRRKFRKEMKGCSTEKLHRHLEKVDPGSSSRIHPNDRYRIIRALEVYTLTGTTMSEHIREHREKNRDTDINYIKAGLRMNRELLYRRINERTERMLDGGWIEEVEQLLESGVDTGWPGMQTLGYPEVVSYIRGEMERGELAGEIALQTRRYAKRQLTWFRKEEGVHWIDMDRISREEALEIIDELLKNG